MAGTIDLPNPVWSIAHRTQRLARVLEKVDAVCWQKYLDWPNIENWSDESNRIVLVGESSRPLIVRTPISFSVYAPRTTLIPRSLAARKAVAYL